MTDFESRTGEIQTELPHSMKGTGRCPTCGCRQFLHTKRIVDRGHDDRERPMSLRTQKMFVFAQIPVGIFEILICTNCKRVEWYLPDLNDDDIETLAKQEDFELIDAAIDSGNGPFR